MSTNTDILKKYKIRRFAPLFRDEADFDSPLMVEFVERVLPELLCSWAAKNDYDFSLGTFIHSFGCSVSFVLKLAEKFPAVKSSLGFAVESAKLKISESVYNRFRAEFLIRFLDSMFNTGASFGIPDVIIFKPADAVENASSASASSEI